MSSPRTFSQRNDTRPTPTIYSFAYSRSDVGVATATAGVFGSLIDAGRFEAGCGQIASRSVEQEAVKASSEPRECPNEGPLCKAFACVPTLGAKLGGPFARRSSHKVATGHYENS